ncbi:bifunctional glutamine synthetase adenylyltransferase/deadenyltransferase [Solemya pervernicosa gill symbiont]|uniref:Bifunctional glutamine synthetase adenylyltransferase/adenylyl-removing enzyme n=2 Tax=Gammaproteobacteria incertae sedis TaxID=118884 RepID=A0A1T2L983_9GAMM|nr:bifunctional glutamine synthetase adenylyltransferase/deadenyltransferase [Solemya pervernicosa gill symbiont]QKQ28352.1 bifunctional [glutamate--ammonia ligase]-adenylyl-L-tyrosine phosphorylase/[glutamate--ammonia-ligase] adenylyltransferase [Candidatus Reidiella endopervernicosa]
MAVIPEPLQSVTLHHWQQFVEAAERHECRVPESEDFQRVTLRVLCSSEFVAQACAREPGLIGDLLESGDLLSDYLSDEYVEKLDTQLKPVKDEMGLMLRLRRFRRREMVRIAWRDLAGWSGLEETLRDLTHLAEACIDGALQKVEAWARKQHGTPKGSDGKPLGLVVLGMGKLGAWELNFSSDIDLIYAYAEEGETRKRNGLSNSEFFGRMGQQLARVLDQSTDDGFVYRVDLRLRPYGDSGPVAMSFDAMEEYYQTQGREWERYAMIKARVVAGDRDTGAELMSSLRPFVYRRYLDYGVFESLREMKGMIAREVARKGMAHNVKLGPGGIREIEFIGQAFQLVRGGREVELQERRILKVLAALPHYGLIPDYASSELIEAYDFLRRVENRLQAWADRQTHLLPQEEIGQLRLAFSMGFSNWERFLERLDSYRQRVEQHFEQIFAAPQTEDKGGEQHAGPDLVSLWQEGLKESQAPGLLAEAGYAEPKEIVWRLRALRESSLYESLSTHGRERLDRLMPLLISAVGENEKSDEALPRVVNLIEAVARRSAYIALLSEHPLALSQLVSLCSASPWIARYLASHPILLDELLDPRTLYSPPDRERLVDELRQMLLRLPLDDLEQQMEVLRLFKQTNVLRVAAADIAEAMPLMVVSDHLTWIAEGIVDEVLELAWHHLVAKHGRPVCSSDGTLCDKGFAVIAYGKMGGLELGYGSDLDVVFLHSAEDESQLTTGKRAMAVPEFFARLGQRIVHLMTTLTPAGVLYEIDLRLRPSGASGLLVSNLTAFEEYQQGEAWTWEHQALVRARPVAGDPLIAERFMKIRHTILTQRREPEELRKAVSEMRERMRSEFGSKKPGRFKLKHDRGGIADIEFMVQYGVLAWAHDHPELTEFTDNIRILEGFGRAGLMAADEVALLCDAYRVFRKRAHHLTLQEQSAEVDAVEFSELRETVAAMWRQRMEDPA